jgi:hypothetical protein
MKLLEKIKVFRYHPEWEPKYLVRDGKRFGPFLYSTAWTLIEKQAEIIFGEDKGESWRKILKQKAYNKSYLPPDNHIHLAIAVISFLSKENRELKEQLIEAKKEISTLKRNK